MLVRVVLKRGYIYLHAIDTRIVIEVILEEIPASWGRPHRNNRHGTEEYKKKDHSSMILHNLRCYQFQYVDQMIDARKSP